MSTTTNKLRLVAREIAQLSPNYRSEWNNPPTQRWAAVPDPNINECPNNTDEKSGGVTDTDAPNRGFFQWISPPLDGAQTINATDSADIFLNARDEQLLGGGHNIRTRIHMRVVDSSGSDRGSSLITFATGSGTDPISTSETLTQFYSTNLENTVAAQDGDRIVVEAGITWSTSGVPFDAGSHDTHGPGHVFADDQGYVLFSRTLDFKDEHVCAVGGISTGEILGGAGPGNVLAPSCDNTTFGG